MEDEYGKRTPDNADIEALAMLVNAADKVGSADEKFIQRVNHVFEVWVEQFGQVETPDA